MSLSLTFTRTCARQNLAIRSASSKSFHLQQTQTKPQHLRQLTTTTQPQAQPIALTSNTTPASASESSSLSSTILSRASTTTDATPSKPSPQQNSTSSSASTTTNTQTPTSPFLLLGTVTRTGTMTSTVQLTSRTQTFDRFLQKHYTRPTRLLAHDPNPAGYLREGDVVEYGLFSDGEKAQKEEKRRTLETRLVEKGVIRLKTRRGRERKLEDVGVKKRGPRWVVRRVVGPFGVAVEERSG